MKNRLSRIFNPATGRTVMLAIDHGYFQGPTTGLERIDLTIAIHRFPKVLWGVLLARLLVAPLVTVALGFGLRKLGLALPQETRLVVYLIATMPVAISCSVMTERFSGDTTLAAEGIFYSTFFSLLTVPVIFSLIQRFDL